MKLASTMPSDKEEDEVNIFEDEEDNYQFINTLDRMRVRYDDEGNPCGSNCTYYAYCLMSNRRQTEYKQARLICRGAKEVEHCSTTSTCSSVSAKRAWARP